LKRAISIQSTARSCKQEKRKKLKEQEDENKRNVKEARALALELSLLKRKASLNKAHLSELNTQLSKKCAELEEKNIAMKESMKKVKLQQLKLYRLRAAGLISICIIC
jgi:hypothetical protein